MTAKTHILGGIAVGLMFAITQQKVGVLPLAGTATAAAVGSLFPDIDNRRSKMGSRVKMTSSVIQHTVGHRTLFHSPVFYFILHCLLLLFLPSFFLPYTSAFTLGIASHLALDMLNKKGIPLFYPYPKRFHIAAFRSGGFAEFLFAIMLFVLVLLELSLLLYGKIIF